VERDDVVDLEDLSHCLATSVQAVAVLWEPRLGEDVDCK
jgi:hypothetical protein